jgi:hypothetical protein
VIPADPLRLNPDSLLHYGQLTSNRQSDGGTGFYRFLVLGSVEAERCQNGPRGRSFSSPRLGRVIRVDANVFRG